MTKSNRRLPKGYQLNTNTSADSPNATTQEVVSANATYNHTRVNRFTKKEVTSKVTVEVLIKTASPETDPTKAIRKINPKASKIRAINEAAHAFIAALLVNKTFASDTYNKPRVAEYYPVRDSDSDCVKLITPRESFDTGGIALTQILKSKGSAAMTVMGFLFQDPDRGQHNFGTTGGSRDLFIFDFGLSNYQWLTSQNCILSQSEQGKIPSKTTFALSTFNLLGGLIQSSKESECLAIQTTNTLESFLKLNPAEQLAFFTEALNSYEQYCKIFFEDEFISNYDEVLELTDEKASYVEKETALAILAQHQRRAQMLARKLLAMANITRENFAKEAGLQAIIEEVINSIYEKIQAVAAEVKPYANTTLTPLFRTEWDKSQTAKLLSKNSTAMITAAVTASAGAGDRAVASEQQFADPRGGHLEIHVPNTPPPPSSTSRSTSNSSALSTDQPTPKSRVTSVQSPCLLFSPSAQENGGETRPTAVAAREMATVS